MKSIPTEIDRLLENTVAIFGRGVSGNAAALLLERLGAEYVYFDEDDSSGAVRSFSLGDGKRHPLVIYSPSFEPRHRWLRRAREAGCECLTEIDFASLFWQGRLIAVTGTNGKTTLTEFIAYALKRFRVDAYATGNNRFAFSELCAVTDEQDAVAICEVSSFQADSLRYFRPEALLWTNFYEDHLDWHPSIEDYFSAKWNLVRRLSGGILLAGESVADAARELGYDLPEGTRIIASEEGESWWLPAGSVFTSYPQRENLNLARAFGELEGLPEPALRASAERFPGRRHRLMKVTELGGVGFWNDSKGTNFSASLAAINDFHQSLIWIGGGKDKGGSVERFGREVASRVKSGILIGETAPKLASVFARAGKRAECFSDLQEAVASAYRSAESGDAILFSPGFSSYDMFEDFEDRGTCYERAVHSLKNGSGI